MPEPRKFIITLDEQQMHIAREALRQYDVQIYQSFLQTVGSSIVTDQIPVQEKRLDEVVNGAVSLKDRLRVVSEIDRVFVFALERPEVTHTQVEHAATTDNN
jgi:hypothetical protein